MIERTSIDPYHFRQVLSHLPTGVTVITAYAAGAPTGMAANSLTSVSLEPPLVLFCPARSSATWPEIRESGAFCVNVMASHHEAVTRQFSQRGVDRFAGIEWVERDAGPALPGAVAWIECAIESEFPAGDHTVVIGAVSAIEARPEVDPLVFFRGTYGSFQAAREH